MPKPVLIAVIFTAYFGSITAWLAYIASTGRHREDEPDEDLADLGVRGDEPEPAPDEGPGPMMLKAA